MTYGHTTINIDKEMMERAKELNINISEQFRKFLAVKVEEAEDKTLQEAKKALEAARDKAVEGIDKINEIYRIREENQKKKLKLLETTYAHITEIKEITPEQMTDTEYMTKLIELLRAKYNNRYISVSGIKEFRMLNS